MKILNFIVKIILGWILLFSILCIFTPMIDNITNHDGALTQTQLLIQNWRIYLVGLLGIIVTVLFIKDNHDKDN